MSWEQNSDPIPEAMSLPVQVTQAGKSKHADGDQQESVRSAIGNRYEACEIRGAIRYWIEAHR